MRLRIIIFLFTAFLSIPKILHCQEEKITIKADRIFGDQRNNTIIATGNVEINKASQTVISESISYNKDTGWIDLPSEVKVIDLELGNLFSDKATIKDDLSQGTFIKPMLILSNGSYLQAKEAEKLSLNKSSFTNPVFSVCPNDEIVKNDSIAGNETDLITLHSSNTTIDNDNKRIINKNTIIKFLDFPIFYTPYLSIPTTENKRSSGFLTPSYINNSRLGSAIQTPYFVNVSKNTNLVISPKFYTSDNQLTIETKIKQLLKYGQHDTKLELSNNKISSSADINSQNRTEAQYRYKASSLGDFTYNKNTFVNFDILTVGDKDYLRDFDFNFIPYTQSELNYEYTKNRNYLKISSVRFQELEETEQRDQAQWVLPSISHHIQSKPKLLNETYSLTTNVTSIVRENGLQYNRLSTIPSVQIPINFHGNLFNLTLSNQIDYYRLEYNFEDSQNQNVTRLNNSQSNNKPSFSVNWKLPLIKKTTEKTTIIEPQIKFISSSQKKDYSSFANEDSNNSELTVNNLFSGDRLAGYDRNENGERVSYGVNSAIYSDKDKFEFNIGQSYLINEETQDVAVNGFNNTSKSNIVGKTSYEYGKIFDITYNFQLDESDLNNKINYATANLHLDKFTLSNDYLLIRRGALSDEKLAQNTSTLSYKIAPKLILSGSVTKNLVTKTDLLRRISLKSDGCCIITEFIVSETNTSNLTKKQRSFNLNVTIREL